MIDTLTLATFVMAGATLLVALVSGCMAYLNFRQMEFQFRPDFDAKLEWDEEKEDLYIIFKNYCNIPLKADIYICIGIKVPESEWAKVPEAKFLKSRKPLSEEVRKKAELPMLGHLPADLYGKGHIRQWRASPAMDEFIREKQVNMQLHPYLEVRFDGHFQATVTRWPFKTKWPYQHLYTIYKRENRWYVVDDEFID